MPPRKGKPIGDIATALMQTSWQNYMPAGKPPKPNARGGPRTWDYPAFFNEMLGQELGVEPERDATGLDFSEIRKFADEHEVTRTVIETCKDQLTKLRWTWRLKPKAGQTQQEIKEASETDSRIKELNKFFKYPDKEHDFTQWLRIWLEDLLVCDAVSVWRQPNRIGGLYALRIIDVGTIQRKIDEMGVTPAPVNPYPYNIAYQQSIKGMVMSEFTTDDMFYYIRNPRSWAFYGYSAVEQIIMTLATGMRRMAFQLAHYTEGNIPPMFLRAPKEWTLEQIKDFQAWWDIMISTHEDLSKGWMIPGDIEPIFPQKENLKDDFDEWVARVVCYAFSVSPNAFIKNLNRATSEQAREQADEEGLQSRMTIITTIMNHLQEKWFGYEDIEFHLVYDRPQDSKKQAEIDNIDIRNGVKSVDEVRRERGYPPIGAPNRVYTNNGYIPLTEGDEGRFDVFQQRLETGSTKESESEEDSLELK
jgi:hypothetical protein